MADERLSVLQKEVLTILRKYEQRVEIHPVMKELVFKMAFETPMTKFNDEGKLKEKLMKRKYKTDKQLQYLIKYSGRKRQSVYRCLKTMEKKGLVKRIDFRNFGITPKGYEILENLNVVKK